MTEICTVKKIKSNLAYVELKQKKDCGGCKACSFHGNDTILVPALIERDCKEGDTVVVRMPEKNYLLAPILLFGIPLIFFLLGLFAGRMIGNEILMVAFGFLFGAVGFVLAYFIDKSLRTNKLYMPVVEDKILETFEENNIS